MKDEYAAKEQYPRVKQIQRSEDEADEEKRHRKRGAELHPRRDRIAELQKTVALLILYGMADFVSGNADGGDAAAGIYTVRKAQHL